jgi:hypothetical protein
MSLVPNQSYTTSKGNIFATTPTASIYSIQNLSSINGVAYSGGGSSNFPSGITIGTDATLVQSNTRIISIKPIVVGPGNTSASSTYIAPTAISYQQIGSGTTHIFNTYDEATGTMGLTNIASINSNAPVVADGSNTSLIQYGIATLDGAGNASIVLPKAYKTTGSFFVLTTNADVPATITPYVMNTSNDSFNIMGDSNVNVNWLSIGVQ